MVYELREEFDPMYRKVEFTYYLLDKNLNIVKELLNVVGGSVSYDVTSTIKRTAKFTLLDNLEDVDYPSSYIMPVMMVRSAHDTTWEDENRPDDEYMFLLPFFPQMVPSISPGLYWDQGWEGFPLGVFALSNPKYSVQDEVATVSVDGYDLSIILEEIKIDRPINVNVGDQLYSHVDSLISRAGIWGHVIPSFQYTADKQTEYEIGTSYLTIINDLLKQAGYVPLNFTAIGEAVSFPYTHKDVSVTTHKYWYGEGGNILKGATKDVDYSGAFNVYHFYLSNDDQLPIIYRLINDDPDDELSVVNRGREITYTEKVTDIIGSTALRQYGERVMAEHSAGYSSFTFDTPINPTHCCYNYLEISYPPLGIDGKYLETSWEFPLEPGGRMTHTVQLSEFEGEIYDE